MRTQTQCWSGRILSAIFVMFMLGASVAPKLLHMPVAETTLIDLGWPAGHAFQIGLLELACVALYVWPRTSVLGAVLMTGLLGGAIATQCRVGNPLYSHILFGIYLGLLMWSGLYLRDDALRAMLPLTRR